MADARQSMRIELTVLLLLMLAVHVWSIVYQPLIVRAGGLGWDGELYGVMSWRIEHGLPVTTIAPFVFRPGVPAVAAALPFDLLTSWYVINHFGAALSALLLWAWARPSLNTPIGRMSVPALYILHWLAPVRITWWMPVSIDPVMFVLIFTWLLYARRFERCPSRAGVAVMTLLGVTSAFIRETLLLMPLVLLFNASRHVRIASLVALGCGVLTLIALRQVVEATREENFAEVAIYWLDNKPAVGLLLAPFAAFGALPMALVVSDARRAGRWLCQHPDMGMYLAGCIAFAVVGGSDTERILFWAAPVVLLLAGRAFERLLT